MVALTTIPLRSVSVRPYPSFGLCLPHLPGTCAAGRLPSMETPGPVERWLDDGWSLWRVIYGVVGFVIVVATVTAYAATAHHPGAVWYLVATMVAMIAWLVPEMLRWRQDDVLVLDEASQLGTADLALIAEAARLAGARVIVTVATGPTRRRHITPARSPPRWRGRRRAWKLPTTPTSNGQRKPQPPDTKPDRPKVKLARHGHEPATSDAPEPQTMAEWWRQFRADAYAADRAIERERHAAADAGQPWPPTPAAATGTRTPERHATWGRPAATRKTRARARRNDERAARLDKLQTRAAAAAARCKLTVDA
jgi:hypothetical protein